MAQIIKDIKDQRYSNIFYLPEGPNVKEEYIVYLDQIFCVPTEDMVIFQQNIDLLRMAALDNFGFYLFVLKLSYHLNRLPEDLQR